MPAEKPSWLQIGPYEAKNVTRKDNVVTAEIEIASDAPLGLLLDCHLEFADAGRGPLVFKKNDAFRVVE